MPKTKRVRIAAKFVTAEAGASAVCALIASIGLLFPGNPAEHAIVWNISAARLILAAPPLAIFAAAAVVLVRGLIRPADLQRLPAWVIKGQATRWVAWALAALGAVGLLLPPFAFGELADCYVRLRPLVIWMGTAGAQMLTIVWLAGGDSTRRHLDAWIESFRPLVRPAAWITLTLVALGVVMAMTVGGVRTYEDYRYEPGVPILALQVAAAILAGIVFRRTVEPWVSRSGRRIDVVIFILIWSFGAAYWASLPAPISYMNPEPLPPNEEIYPFSDAAGYDLQAQAAVLGLGLQGGQAVPNPLYPTALTVVHLISGQDFAINMRLQAALLAVLPGLAYLLGRRLQGRTLGVSAACMVALHGANTILAGGMLNTASPKQMLTDFPAAIGVALVMLSALGLADRKTEVVRATIWHGASVAFAYMIRPTALVLLAVLPIGAWLRERAWKGRMRVVLLSVAAFALFVLPWGIRNVAQEPRGWMEYLAKFNLITRTRYANEQRDPQDHRPPDEPKAASTAEPSEWVPLNPEYHIPERPPQMDTRRVVSVIAFHFANNVMGSVLILPTSPVLHDLRHEVRAAGSLWEHPWDGTLGFWQIFWLGLSAGALAVGGTALWRVKGAVAALPLAVLVLYLLANSIGRTSGGRYVVPVDWIVFLYYAAGLLAILEPGMVSEPARGGRAGAKAAQSRQGWIPALAAIVLLGASPLLVEAAVPRHFPAEAQLAESVDANARSALLRAGFGQGEIDAYAASNRSGRFLGRAFYPRWFSYRAIVTGAEGNLQGVQFPHLQFALMGADGWSRDVVLFTAGKAKLTNASDVLVLGCRGDSGERGIEALAVVDLSEGAGPLLISDRTALRCGQPRPVCEVGGNCE